MAVACSGGRDSIALLHATGLVAGRRPVVALHVHHGLSAHADAWLAHVERQCDLWRAALPADLALRAARLALRPGPGDSLEALAREGRHAALARMAREAGCATVLLAHHREDQAETFLLQALRGGGAAGLAAMPEAAVRDGLRWCRPWLTHPRAAIEAHVARHRLAHVEDDSNADPRHARNRLRLQVWPALAAAFPQAPQVLGEATRRARDAAECLDALAALDLAAVRGEDGALRVEAAAALSPARRRNLMRVWLRGQGVAVRASRIVRLAEEAFTGVSEAAWPVESGRAVRLHRGWLRLAADGPAGRSSGRPVGPDAVALPDLRGLEAWPLPAWGGVLRIEPVDSGGLPREALVGLEARPRQGGERHQREPGTPPRALKKQYQFADVPAWARGGPLIWRGDRLVFVPGLGLDARVRAVAGGPQVMLRWCDGAGTR